VIGTAHRYRRAVNVLAGALLLVGTGAAPAGDADRQEPRTLRIGLVSTGALFPLPPAMMPESPERWVMQQVYGPGLVWPGTEMDAEPELALATRIGGTALPNALIYQIRDDVQFHDPNASLTGILQYQETYELYSRLAREGAAEIDPVFAYVDTVYGLPAVDREEYPRIRIDLTDAQFIPAARRIATVNLFPESVLRVIKNLGMPDLMAELIDRDPAGLGGYRLVLGEGQQAAERSRPVFVLEANPNYFGGEPEFERVEIVFYRTDRQLVQAFFTDQIDVVSLPNWRISNALDRQLQSTSRNKVFRQYPLRDHFFFLAFNCSHALLRQSELRRAIAYGLDRNRMRDGPAATGRISDVPIFPELSEVRSGARRGRTAQAILQQLGYQLAGRVMQDRAGRQLRFTLHYPNHVEHYETMARRVVVDLANLGIVVEPAPVSPLEVRNRLRSGDYQMAIFEMTMHGTPDVIRKYFHSDNAESGVNFTRYESRTFNTAIEAVLRGMSLVEFWDRGVLRRLTLDYPLVPLYFPAFSYYAFNNEVVHPNSVGQMNTRLEPIASWRRPP